jgi:histidinol-phosphate aminotransferase
MSHQYQRPTAGGALRLHLNENTAGCSPRVIDAIRGLTREDAAIYPDYDAVTEACAARLGVEPSQLLLTNGLDEGILLAAIVALRGAPAADPYEAIVVQPAFDMYAACADGMGGRIVDVPPRPDFSFPLDGVLAALTPRTRLICLTSPNNPTGVSVSTSDVAATCHAAPGALCPSRRGVRRLRRHVDDAGSRLGRAAESGGRTDVRQGLRAGRVARGRARRRPDTLGPMRRIVPPYTLNACAAAGLPAALEDEDYYQWYCAEVRASKRLLYDALTRLGVPFWPSDGNFVLARFGEDVGRVIAGLSERGIAIRDRSRDAGCAGCARMTAGVVAHTERLVRALEEVLCGAR